MRYVIILLLLSIISGCKTDKKKEALVIEKEYTLSEKIANANGFQNWKEVTQLKFTFNVDRDTSHFERTWIWDIKENQVTSISNNETIIYNRAKLDSTSHQINGGFVNDKYWLLAPFNLIWDKDNYTHNLKEDVVAPISKKAMQKLTITYSSDGGYTPGDAYDFYFEDDFQIKEWVFRKANQPEPSLITTWEDYVEKGGLKIAQTHKNDEGFKLYFTEIEVNTK